MAVFFHWELASEEVEVEAERCGNESYQYLVLC